MKLTTLILWLMSIILVASGSLKSLKTGASYEWDKYTTKFPGQGALGACQTFSILRGMQLCINTQDKNEKVTFDAVALFNEIGINVNAPNEYNVSAHLNKNSVKDSKSNRKFSFTKLPAYKGEVGKMGNGSPGFTINVYDENAATRRGTVMKFIKENVQVGSVSVGCNLDIFGGATKERLNKRKSSNSYTDDPELLAACSKQGTKLTHVILITGQKEVKVSEKINKKIYSIVDSAGDPNLGLGNNDAFVSYLTESEVSACLTWFALSINCDNLTEA